MILNDQIMKAEDFDKYFIEIFMTYSLKDLTDYSNPDVSNPKHPLLLRDLKKDTMITDGYTAYVSIIESLQMDHQKCVFSQNDESTNACMENNGQIRVSTKKQRK